MTTCRFADYLQREGKLDDVRANLELKRGGLLCGRVRKELLDDPLKPSAPLRAFSYTQAGGRQTCGDKHRINPVFKCPDGYAGSWAYAPGECDNEDGYEDYESDGNPFSNKISAQPPQSARLMLQLLSSDEAAQVKQSLLKLLHMAIHIHSRDRKRTVEWTSGFSPITARKCTRVGRSPTDAPLPDPKVAITSDSSSN